PTIGRRVVKWANWPASRGHPDYAAGPEPSLGPGYTCLPLSNLPPQLLDEAVDLLRRDAVLPKVCHRGAGAVFGHVHEHLGRRQLPAGVRLLAQVQQRVLHARRELWVLTQDAAFPGDVFADGFRKGILPKPIQELGELPGLQA